MDHQGRYIRTLIHVLSLVIRDQSSYSSIGYILVRLVCTQPTTLLTSTVDLVLLLWPYLIQLPLPRYPWRSQLGRYTTLRDVDQPGLIIRKVRDTIEYCANSNSSVRRLGRVVFERSFVTNTRTQRLWGEPGCNSSVICSPYRVLNRIIKF